MSDIDYDELDKAVQSVSNNMQDSTAAVPVADQVQDSQPSPTPTPPSPVVEMPTPTPIAAPTPPMSPVAPRPSTGHFMDVVHPTSDMRRPVSLPTRARPSVAPPVEEQSLPPIETIESSDTPSASTLPDSPFISGATVEKRPLGAFSVDTPESPAPSYAPVEATPAPIDDNQGTIDQPPISPAAPEDAISADDESSLEKIESDGSMFEGTSQPEPDEPASADATSKLPEPTGPTQITQQYTEKPSTGEKENGSIYDTDTYHKAIAPTAKKKAGWLWIVWIVLFIIIGVAAGASFYFYILPNLR